MASKYEFQCCTAKNSTMTPISALDSGRMMRTNVPITEQPSIAADSSISFGMESKNERQMMQLYMLKPPRMMSVRRLLYRPMLFTSRKLGMMPPEKYIVNMKKNVKNLWPGSCRFVST